MNAIIIGLGNVGKATAAILRSAFELYGYDRDEAAMAEWPAWDMANAKADAAFICVPTPSAEDGRLDITAVEEAVSWAKTQAQCIIVRSTMPFGATRSLKLPELIYWPCFSREASIE